MAKHSSYHSIKSKLPWGAQTEIANSLNLSPDTVSKVLKGEFRNDEVIQACLNYLKALKDKKEALLEQIEALV